MEGAAGRRHSQSPFSLEDRAEFVDPCLNLAYHGRTMGGYLPRGEGKAGNGHSQFSIVDGRRELMLLIFAPGHSLVPPLRPMNCTQ
jgi:hypothetical protein